LERRNGNVKGKNETNDEEELYVRRSLSASLPSGLLPRILDGSCCRHTINNERIPPSPPRARRRLFYPDEMVRLNIALANDAHGDPFFVAVGWQFVQQNYVTQKVEGEHSVTMQTCLPSAESPGPMTFKLACWSIKQKPEPSLSWVAWTAGPEPRSSPKHAAEWPEYACEPHTAPNSS
jgi:hypothetical protein